MKLVDKDSVLAEIENIIADENESIKSFEHGKNVSEVQRSNARIGILIHIRSLLDTLEVVKEVDLEKELTEWHKKHFSKKDTFNGKSGFYLTNSSQLDIAKHFFELGLKAQKGE